MYLLNTDLCELQHLSYAKKGGIFLKKGWKAFLLMFWNIMLTLVSLDKMQKNSTLCAKARNLRAEHFESYSSFSYCTHSTIYRLFWPSDWVITCI